MTEYVGQGNDYFSGPDTPEPTCFPLCGKPHPPALCKSEGLNRIRRGIYAAVGRKSVAVRKNGSRIANGRNSSHTMRERTPAEGKSAAWRGQDAHDVTP